MFKSGKDKQKTGQSIDRLTVVVHYFRVLAEEESRLQFHVYCSDKLHVALDCKKSTFKDVSKMAMQFGQNATWRLCWRLEGAQQYGPYVEQRA